MNTSAIIFGAAALCIFQVVWAQNPPATAEKTPAPEAAAPPAPASSSSEVQPVSKSLGVLVYPAKGQTGEKQSVDEQQCYNWAKTQTRIDPQAPAPSATSTESASGPGGERVKSAARGAAAGALIGEVADNDADQGARVGATTGVLAGGRKAREQKRAQEEKGKTDVQAAQTEQQTTFKKAFGTCMQGRGYTTD